MFPEIPTDLTELSDEQLAALLTEVTAWFDENRADPNVDLADLRRARDAKVTISTAQTERATAAEERQAEIEALAAEMADPPPEDPPADPPDETPAPPAEGDPPAPPSEGVVAEAVGPSAEAIAAAVSAGVRQVLVDLQPTAEPGSRLAAMARHRPASRAPRVAAAPRAVITAAAGLTDVEPGGTLADMRVVAEQMSKRWPNIGKATGVTEEKVLIASIKASIPEERQLDHEDQWGNQRKVDAVTSLEAIVAAGGLCAPVEPYYDIQVVASAARPVRDALPGFGAARGGIRLVPPPQFTDISGAARTVADGATNSNTTVTSATAAFTSFDIGAAISGTGIPASTTILSVQSGTSVTISAAATATATGVSITIQRVGGVGTITVAQDLAGGGASVKSCVSVACAAQVEYDIAAVYHCIEFNNIGARTFPEQVAGWNQLLMANHARVAETNLLNGIASASKQLTAPAGYGTLREFKARMLQAAAGYRNRNRMTPETPVRVLAPAWAIRAVQADGARTFTDDPGFWEMQRADVERSLAGADVNISWYLDSATGKGQIWAAQVTGNPITPFPSNIVFYMFAEGTFLFLDGGELDLGLVRDTVLTMGTAGPVPVPGNRFREFGETFENVAFVGVESVEITMPTLVNGAYPAGVTAIAAGTLG